MKKQNSTKDDQTANKKTNAEIASKLNQPDVYKPTQLKK